MYYMGQRSAWETVGFELWLGTPAGDFHKIDASYEPEQRCVPNLAALWNDFLLVAHTNCYPDPGASISDLSDPDAPATRIPIPEGARDVKMAGHYVAWFVETAPDGRWNEQLIVYDWLAGREAYRVDVSSYVVNASISHELEFDLQEDGMVVGNMYGERIWDPGRVIWASVDAPTIHELPLHAGRFDIATHGGLIALRNADARYYAVVDTQAREQNVFALTGNRAGVNYLDFDGHRLLWLEDGILYNEPYPVAPTAVLPTGTATVDSTGMAKIPVWCSQPKARCSGSVLLKRSGSPAKVRGVVGHHRFRIGARKTRAVKVPLTRHARRLLLHRRLGARVTVSTKHSRRGQRVKLVRR